QDATTDQAALHLLGSVPRRALAGDLVGRVAVVHLAGVEDVGQRVPMGGRLQVQNDRVIGVAHPPGKGSTGPLLPSHRVVGTGGHRVPQAVEPAVGTGLRSVLSEVHGQGDDLARPYQRRGTANTMCVYVVRRAALVVGAPLPP